jgi:hypothetical protein
MNKRIKELEKQCLNNQTNRLDVEKFAELLLQECMNICENLGDKGMDGHYCVDKIRRELKNG